LNDKSDIRQNRTQAVVYHLWQRVKVLRESVMVN